MMLAPSEPFEDLLFEHALPEPSQARELRFDLERSGEVCGRGDPRPAQPAPPRCGTRATKSLRCASQLRGLALHIELFLSEAQQRPEVSSAEPGSHWANVMVLLEPTPVEAGAQLLVRAAAELAGSPPRYTFEAWLGERGAPAETMRSLGAVSYP